MRIEQLKCLANSKITTLNFDMYIFYMAYVSTNRGVHFKDNTIQSYGIGLSGEHTNTRFIESNNM